MNDFIKQEFGDWYFYLKNVLESEEFSDIPKHLKNSTPVKQNLFKAFKQCQLKDVKVVILGQNPYPTKGHATGLAFGVPSTILSLPPTLTNIIHEVERNTGKLKIDFDVTLESWSNQGVLLLNTALTTLVGEVNNVHGKMWEPLIREVFNALSNTYVVYMLWGNHAKGYRQYIKSGDVLETSHPSPMSVHKGFNGCNHFNEANKLLKSIYNTQIKW